MSKVALLVNKSTISALNKKFDQLKQAALDQGEIVVSRNTQAVFGRAQSRCPVDTYALSDSARMEIGVKDDIIEGAVGYGSEVTNPRTSKPTSLYAVERHEALTVFNPGAYKWLERSTLEQADDFQKELVEAYSGLLGGG